MTSLRRADRTRSGFEAAERELGPVLERLDETSNYTTWLVDLFRPHLGDLVAEVGAGTGTITERIAADERSVIAIEPAAELFRSLRGRFEDSETIECVNGDHTALNRKVDSIVLSNVLEHIANDADALRVLGDHLRPGGRLVVFSPAFESLYSDFDYRVGHYRRYRKTELVERMQNAGLEVVEHRYVNSLGVPAWFAYARLLGRNPTQAGGLSLWDRWVIPAVRRIEQRVRPPLGQSVLVVGRRR